ncbi:precorrin-3B synthase [Mycolicibacterium pyrenivorans]|uniref:precorrin-3B synthase n=1 Tax=Mycolicibacterium pyrenivorans TaxID=187102 RepID=UPI0021F3139E|nr:precorrin-3B synthase [Mycolicibacterium pyrenivorans]MCV7150982.1 precorrin-3B synthase [Mycolicibacterium pyrenivorans]
MNRARDDDACPGALQTHHAADGELARLRLPGGMISAAQLEAVAQAAMDSGNSTLELTSRGNLQIRGVRDTAAVAARLSGAGLLPSPTHERVRNIVASPLSGRSGGIWDVRGLVAALDSAVQHEPGLSRLPGRFLFGIDDGRGDISGLGADTGVHALDECTAALLLAGRDTGVRLTAAEVIPELLAIADRFLMIRGKRWRVEELDDPSALLGPLKAMVPPGASWPAQTRPPVGWIEQTDGRVTLGAGVPLGVLDAETARYLAAVEAPMALTPWRSVLLFDLDEGTADLALRVLAPRGLVFDDNSPWLSVSACAGMPGCERSVADVRADAAAAVADPAANPAGHRHFVGCDRACGSPGHGEVLIATGDGYRPRSVDLPSLRSPNAHP